MGNSVMVVAAHWDTDEVLATQRCRHEVLNVGIQMLLPGKTCKQNFEKSPGSNKICIEGLILQSNK